MNPWVILAGVLLFVVAICGTGAAAFRMGRDSEIAARAKTDEIVRASTEAMKKTAAEAISGIEIKHVTLKQQLDTEIREKPVYRDCRATADGLRFINAALTGEDSGPSGDIRLPASPAPDGPDLRSDGAEADGSGDPVPKVP
jgi:hypothetical protein